jgi:alpha-1,2-mannosyltransferase
MPSVARCARGSRLIKRTLIVAWLVLLLSAGVIVLIKATIPNLVPSRGTTIANGQMLGKNFVGFYASGVLANDGRPSDIYDDKIMFAAESDVAGRPVKLHWPYPPGVLLVTAPLAALPYLPAVLIWLGLGLAGAAYATWQFGRRPEFLILLPLCPSFSFCIIFGQTGLIAAGLVAGGMLLLPQRPGLAGILFGLLTIKLQLAFLLPFCLLAGRHVKTLIAMAATGLVLELLAVALFGTGTLLAFLHAASTTLDNVTRDPLLRARVPTIYAAAIDGGLGRPPALAIQVGVSLLAIAAVGFIWHRSKDPSLRALGWAAGLPLSVPYLVDYDLAVFVVPLAGLAWRHWRREIDLADALAITLLWSTPILVQLLTHAARFQIGALMPLALLLYALRAVVRPRDLESSLRGAIAPA